MSRIEQIFFADEAGVNRNQCVLHLLEKMYEVFSPDADRMFEIVKDCGNAMYVFSLKKDQTFSSEEDGRQEDISELILSKIEQSGLFSQNQLQAISVEPVELEDRYSLAAQKCYDLSYDAEKRVFSSWPGCTVYINDFELYAGRKKRVIDIEEGRNRIRKNYLGYL